MNKLIEFHFLEKQKCLYNKEVKTVKMISSLKPFGWINIEGTVWGVVPLGDPSTNGLLLPIKETEEFLKAEYKRLFNIEIPKDVHQWPYKKE